MYSLSIQSGEDITIYKWKGEWYLVIVQMSFVTLAGPKSDIDRVIDTYLSKYEIQLENALVELNSSGNLLPYVEANPYKDILDKSHALLELMDEALLILH